MIILSSAGGGGLLLLLILLTIICIYRKNANDPKRINYNTDENHTYGTYAIDCDGEYEYNVAEVVDNFSDLVSQILPEPNGQMCKKHIKY